MSVISIWSLEMQALRTVILGLCIAAQGCEAQSGFPEDHKIPGSIAVGREWQVIDVDEALEINREGLQALHIVVDASEFSSNSDHNDELSNDHAHLFDLRNQSDELVVPEVVMVAQDGTEVVLRSRSNIYLPDGNLTVGMGLRSDDIYTPSPPYPEGIESFKSFRIRSSVPFEAEYTWWLVEHHPNMHD